jgi:hypothetical protein
MTISSQSSNPYIDANSLFHNEEKYHSLLQFCENEKYKFITAQNFEKTFL